MSRKKRKKSPFQAFSKLRRFFNLSLLHFDYCGRQISVNTWIGSYVLADLNATLKDETKGHILHILDIYIYRCIFCDKLFTVISYAVKQVSTKPI